MLLYMSISEHASVAQSVEYDHGKVGVTGSNPVGGFIFLLDMVCEPVDSVMRGSL